MLSNRCRTARTTVCSEPVGKILRHASSTTLATLVLPKSPAVLTSGSHCGRHSKILFAQCSWECVSMSNNYTGLRQFKAKDGTAGKRCAQRLLALRESLSALRKRKRDSSLLLATWNIRDFDSNKFGFGPRLEESFYYIAEIISCFDLIAVQEVNRNLSGLEKVMRILGREWDYIVTDATEGPGGNEERMAFVFNTDKVWFRKVAGEVVLPEGQLIVSRKKIKKKDGEGDPSGNEAEEAERAGFKEVRQQFARTPFLVAFQSNWFKFSLCTVHIYYGKDTGEELK